jgi:hypothetical protein
MASPGRNLFKDKEHLVRMAGIFALGIVAFLVLQIALVPDTFGLYGHYRASAIGDEQRKPLSFAGRAACVRCHSQQVETQHKGKHATLGCEGCHGALLKHAVAPGKDKPVKLVAAKLCASCHEKNIGRPKEHKQVDTVEHSSGEACTTCHDAHAPQMGDSV